VRALSRRIAELNPGSFALVMATGIVSIAASLLGMRLVSRVLLWSNALFYAALWILTLIRLAAHFPRLAADLTDHARGPGFFTVVAGTCVFGSQLVVLEEAFRAALVLLALGGLLWLVLIYAFFTAVMVRESKPDLGAGIHGGWFIAVVATQSVSILASFLAPRYPASGQGLLFAAFCLYLLGGLLYLVLITLILYRLAFFPLAPAGLPPVYWVAMGAAAITTLAGARLMLDAGQWPFLSGILPFLRGFTLLFWAAAAWWIPLLTILGVWRHLVRRFPLRYETGYWSLVFPLGMYTASTFVLARGEGLAFLAVISRYFIWVAFAAWLLTFAGMIASLAKGLRSR
jgi:tellurite resistance protein TehA-like permease